MPEYIKVEMRLGRQCRPDLYSSIRCKFLIIMAWSLAPYIHVILADVVSIT